MARHNRGVSVELSGGNRTSKIRKIAMTALAAVLAVSLLSGCSDNTKSEQNPQPAPTSQGETPRAQNPETESPALSDFDAIQHLAIDTSIKLAEKNLPDEPMTAAKTPFSYEGRDHEYYVFNADDHHDLQGKNINWPYAVTIWHQDLSSPNWSIGVDGTYIDSNGETNSVGTSLAVSEDILRQYWDIGAPTLTIDSDSLQSLLEGLYCTKRDYGYDSINTANYDTKQNVDLTTYNESGRTDATRYDNGVIEDIPGIQTPNGGIPAVTEQVESATGQAIDLSARSCGVTPSPASAKPTNWL
jgi:hypothetical protein